MVFRAWIIATNFDAVAIPVYEVPPMGNHAWSLAHGVEGVPWHYYYDNAGGQLLTGFLAAPLYALFGASYGVLKLVPFLLGIGLMGLIWCFLRRNVGYRAAVVGVFAFALAPPTLTKYSLLAKGNHFEGLFFLFLPVVLYFEALRRRSTDGPVIAAGTGAGTGNHPGRWLFAAGVAAGFAVSVYFGSLLTLALLALTALTLGVGRGLRDLRYVLPGAAVGLLPFLAIQLATKGRALDFAERFTQPDPNQSASGMWSEARALLVETLPEGACFEPLGSLPSAVGEWTLLIVMAVSWLTCIRVGLQARKQANQDGGRYRAAAQLCALYLPLVLGVIAVGVLKIRPKVAPVEILGVRYLVSFYFYGLLVVAIAVETLLRARPKAGLTLGLALASTWLFVLPLGTGRFDRASDALRYPGTFFRNYGGLFHRDVTQDPLTNAFLLEADHIRKVAAAFEGQEREDLLFSAGNTLAYVSLSPAVDPSTGRMRKVQANVTNVVAAFPPEDRAAIARGFGAHLRTRLPDEGPPPALLRRWLDEALADPVAGSMVAEGMGMSLRYPLRRNWSKQLKGTMNALAAVPNDMRPAVRRGQARDLAVRRRLGLEGSEASIQEAVSMVKSTEQRAALTTMLESLQRSEAVAPVPD